MAPPLDSKQLDILNKEFYVNKNLFGRDKLYQIIKSKYEDTAPSRRQIAEWLAQEEVNQLYRPSKGKAKDIKSSVTTPNTILAIGLINMENFMVNNFKYLLNGIDMSSRYFYSIALKNKTDKEVLQGFKKFIINQRLKQFVQIMDRSL